MKGFSSWTSLIAGVACGLVLFCGTASAADPVVNPGSNFNSTVTGGTITIGTSLDPIEVGVMNPSPRLRNITVNPDGTFSAAAADFVFPQLVLPVDSPVGSVDIFVQIRAANPVTGTIDPATGEISMTTALTIQLTSNHAIVALGNNCYVGTPANPIPFSATGGTAKGVPYDEYAGTTTVIDDTLAIPAASGCPTIVGQDVNAIVNSTMGLPSPSGQNTVELAMRFNPAPHSENWIDPEGPGNIPPTIINDTNVEVDAGVNFRSWLESFTVANDRIQDNFGASSASSRNGNTVRVTLLVKHNPGREVTGIRVDDNWDASDDSDGATIHPVTAEQPDVAGGFNYSKVTLAYEPTTNMGLNCPGLFDPDGTLGRTSQISVRAVLDNGSESESSVSPIKLTREDCNAKLDPPLLYGWEAPVPTGGITPGTAVDFKFRGFDSDEGLTAQQKFGGYSWRTRNLDTGETTPATQVCPGNNLDGALRTLNVTFPKRGRWVVEARPMNMANDILDNQGCIFPGSLPAGSFWSWIGAVDVNSPAEISEIKSPGANLLLPARPGVDNTITASVSSTDPFDVPNSAGGLTQTIEWDLDGDENNGFEVVRYGDSRTGMGPGQNQILIDTSSLDPGFHPVRVRVGDNGALGGADDIRRTNIATGQFMVNTPPVAGDLNVQTVEDNSVATPLSATDTNADGSHDVLTWRLTGAPAHGFLSGEWPNRVYHPEEGFSGTDSFVFEVSDGYGGTDTGTVTVNVTPAPETPVTPVDPGNPGPEKQAFKATFTEGRVNLNEESGPGTSGVKVVDSAVADTPVTFDTKHWDKATGQILAPPGDLVIPAKTVRLSITDPLPLDLDVTIEFGAIGKIGGNFNSTSGALLLDFDAHAMITVNAEGLGQVLKCDVTPIPLSLSTSGSALVDPGNGNDRPPATWSAKAFPAGGEGAVTSLWNNLPNSTAIAEPMAPLASCAGTLDDLIGGKGGFWLGGKVTFDGATITEDPEVPINPPGSVEPNRDTAIFDGKHLHIRLYCPAAFKPACKSKSAPVTKKKKGKAMSKPVKSKIKSGKWKKVTYLIKPKYRPVIQRMVGKKKRMLVIRQKVKAKKFGKKRLKGKSRTFFHKHKVRAG